MNTVLKFLAALFSSLFLFSNIATGQFRFSGQASAWVQYAPDNWMDFSANGRYIPQLNYKIPVKKEHLFDFEVSANINGIFDARLFESTQFDGKIKAYRAWGRYSNAHLEVRAGLQKITFGSAQMIRPLMWFDRMDPRDPLQLTEGVWGVLGRYYFNNNANIWIWGLYGNNDAKGLDFIPAIRNSPEGGGRIQLPLPKGEMAFSYHYRTTNPSKILFPGTTYPHKQVGEHKVGFDIRMNSVVGLWLEASWTRLNRDFNYNTNQEMITAGADYTFGIGNGLLAAFEQFVYSYDKNAFAFAHNTTLSALSLSYPINVFNNIRAMTFYNWTDNQTYLFVTFLKQFNRLSFYITGYWNPKIFALPGMGGSGSRFTGKGAQVMVVWNH